METAAERKRCPEHTGVKPPGGSASPTEWGPFRKVSQCKQPGNPAPTRPRPCWPHCPRHSPGPSLPAHQLACLFRGPPAAPHLLTSGQETVKGGEKEEAPHQGQGACERPLAPPSPHFPVWEAGTVSRWASCPVGPGRLGKQDFRRTDTLSQCKCAPNCLSEVHISPRTWGFLFGLLPAHPQAPLGPLNSRLDPGSSEVKGGREAPQASPRRLWSSEGDAGRRGTAFTSEQWQVPSSPNTGHLPTIGWTPCSVSTDGRLGA